MQPPRVAVVAAVAVLLVGASYLGLTEGLERLAGAPTADAAAPGAVPRLLQDPPSTVPTTEDRGPLGPVSAVFAAGEVREGVLGTMVRPWVGVSSRTGEYRALSAPHRPAPRRGAVSVAPDGRTVAWGFADGVVLYDTVAGSAREVRAGLASEPWVGRFSPDGSTLTVHDGALRLVDVGSGRVVGTAVGVEERAARQAVWADGETLSYVQDGSLVLHRWADDRRTRVRTSVPARATLAWSLDGDQLAAMAEVRGVRSVELHDVAPDGTLTPVGRVREPGYAQQELLGFTGDAEVAVVALRLETGALPVVFAMSTLDGHPPRVLTQLPAGRVAATVQMAGRPLAAGSVDFPEPDWPVSDRAKLVGSVVTVGFLLGLYLTRRRPRT